MIETVVRAETIFKNLNLKKSAKCTNKNISRSRKTFSHPKKFRKECKFFRIFHQLGIVMVVIAELVSMQELYLALIAIVPA